MQKAGVSEGTASTVATIADGAFSIAGIGLGSMAARASKAGDFSLRRISTGSAPTSELGEESISISAAKTGTQAESKVFLVAKEGVVLPKGAKIPSEFSENAFRSSNYGTGTGKNFVEKVRIDPGTPSGFKGPNESHFHLNNGDHIFDATKWPWW